MPPLTTSRVPPADTIYDVPLGTLVETVLVVEPETTIVVMRRPRSPSEVPALRGWIRGNWNRPRHGSRRSGWTPGSEGGLPLGQSPS